MLLVTGVSGRFGSEVAAELTRRGVAWRGFARDPSRAPDGDIVQGSFEDSASLTRALDGVTAMFLVCADGKELPALEGAAVAAARAQGTRIVKISAMVAAVDPPTSFGIEHRPAEQTLIASGLDYTILRPGFVLQTILSAFGADIRKGRLIVPSRQGRVAFVDQRDVAKAAANVLVDGAAHVGKTYSLMGPTAVTFSELAAACASATGHPVKHVAPPRAVARLMLPLVGGMSFWNAGRVVQLLAAIDGGLQAVPSGDLDRLLGVPGTSVEAFLAEHAGELS